ncbi:cytochrome c biogenesis CcdA family protein [Amycolatopsis saalfeldensis]|uniref:Cytochrome c biogenesis protein CcdA n=1 Tax=Amycolatopsis saalfeldensis TaxID=394193 RepID=A0A1H8YM99_9PSEU|nr:cytochrome c biogenesis CcdA family protein [Amycolatopsis saalfeldensis]SEP53334.1 Cytochrome c biogenesis protein CcdA [Amycolatopsis saalfeldensis]
MGQLLFGTTLVASFLGGVVALLAPCCVSVMLPAYLATGFRHRGGVVPATLVFGAGVATVILPIGLGATALSRLLVTGHLWIFSIGGVLMVAGGVAVLAGWKPNLPMPGARAVKEGSFGSAYVLGAFSGAASACCAPVLAGVAVLSGAAASFPAALSIGAAYVAGMVAPLALVALLWDTRRERAARLLTDRTIRLRLGRWQRRLALGSAISGGLMIAMGVLAVVLAFTGPGMPSSGWQTELSAWLQHVSSLALYALSWIPGWALLLVLLLGFALLLRRARRSKTATTATTAPSACCAAQDDTPTPATVDIAEENRREQEQR